MHIHYVIYNIIEILYIIKYNLIFLLKMSYIYIYIYIYIHTHIHILLNLLFCNIFSNTLNILILKRKREYYNNNNHIKYLR